MGDLRALLRQIRGDLDKHLAPVLRSEGRRLGVTLGRTIRLAARWLAAPKGLRLSLVLAVLLVGAAAIVSLGLASVIENQSMLLYLGAITLGAAFGGLAPGAIATVLSVLCYIGLPNPDNSVLPLGPVPVALFALLGLLISIVIDSFYVANRRAELERASAFEGARRSKYLARVSAMLTASVDYETTLANVARLAVPALADVCLIDIVEDDDSLKRLGLADPGPEAGAFAARDAPDHPAGGDPTGVAERVVRTGQSEFCPKSSAEPLAATVDDEGSDVRARSNLRSYICVPLVAAGRTIGALTLGYSEAGRVYTVQDLEMAKDLAPRIALAVDNARLMYEVKRHSAEIQRYTERLEALATTDGLTGLLNHRAFRERLQGEFQRARRYSEQLSVVLLDVDRFKAFNDAFGHPAGDEVLRTLSRLLSVNCRDSDIVARYGGEEFVILLPHTGIDQAVAVAERCRAGIEREPWPLRSVTASFGLASLDQTAQAAADVLLQADQALYASKRSGGNRLTTVGTEAGAGPSYEAVVKSP